jgi:hypothetical protein
VFISTFIQGVSLSDVPLGDYLSNSSNSTAQRGIFSDACEVHTRKGVRALLFSS